MGFITCLVFSLIAQSTEDAGAFKYAEPKNQRTSSADSLAAIQDVKAVPIKSENKFVSMPNGDMMNVQIFSAIESPRGDYLFLPGFADTSVNHRELVEALVQEGFRVISVDYPSHGRSIANLQKYTLRKLVGYIQLTVKVVRGSRHQNPIHLGGWSTGGLLATLIAKTNWFKSDGPRIRSLSLIAPAIFPRLPLIGDWGRVTLDTLTNNEWVKAHEPLAPIKPMGPYLYPFFAMSLLWNSIRTYLSAVPDGIPTLLIVAGKNDRYVSSSRVLKWFNRGGQKQNTKVVQMIDEFHALDWAPHGRGRDVIQTVANWAKTQRSLSCPAILEKVGQTDQMGDW